MLSVLAIDHPTTGSGASAGVPPAEAAPQRLRSLARAAQQDILGRLAAPLRHDMVVHLQSLGLVAEALSARTQRGAVNAEDLQGSVANLNRLSRNAVAHCLQVCSWMQPAGNDQAPLAEVASEIVNLLATSLGFRGFELTLEAGDGEADVSRNALRFLLAGAILSLVDEAPAPGKVSVRTQDSSSHGVVTVEWQPQAEGSPTLPHAPSEAPLSWTELQALALQHAAELLRKDDSIVLRLPRAPVKAPLEKAPA